MARAAPRRSGSMSASDDSGSEGERDIWKQDLYRALSKGEVHAVRNILGDHGNPINDPMFKINMGVTAMGTLSIAEGATPLHVAAYHGRHQLVAWLVKQGADVSARDGMHMTPAEVTQSKRVIKELENSRRLRKSYAKMRKDQGVDARLDALEAMARQGGFDRRRKKGAVDLSEIEIMVDDLRLELETHCDDSGVKFSTVDQRLDELQHALAQQASLNLNDIYNDLQGLTLSQERFQDELMRNRGRDYVCRCMLWSVLFFLLLALTAFVILVTLSVVPAAA